jgi:hypothetical protein
MTQKDEINFENVINCTICCDIFSNTSIQQCHHLPLMETLDVEPRVPTKFVIPAFAFCSPKQLI